MCGMQTVRCCALQTFWYVWNADIQVCVQCKYSCVHGMQTVGYVWNADILLEKTVHFPGEDSALPGEDNALPGEDDALPVGEQASDLTT